MHLKQIIVVVHKLLFPLDCTSQIRSQENSGMKGNVPLLRLEK